MHNYLSLFCLGFAFLMTRDGNIPLLYPIVLGAMGLFHNIMDGVTRCK
jgi:hypothetical protein